MLDRVRLENILEKSSVSLPDDAKAAAGMDAAQLSLRLSGVDVSSQPALPAPPAPLGLACPPPPPPLVPGGPIPPGAVFIKHLIVHIDFTEFYLHC